MLDLKAKLLQAGLVTEEQVSKAETEQAEARAKRAQPRAGGGGGKGKKGRGKGSDAGAPPSEEARWQRRLEQLKQAPKSDQYEAIRGWVQRTRLDQVKGLPSEQADRFHFAKHDGHISWLTLEPDVKQQLSEGAAGIIAFMSHNGLAHCVVPRDVAADVGQVRSDWVRHLDGFEIETLPPKAPEAPPGEEAPPAEAEALSDSGSSAGSAPPAET